MNIRISMLVDPCARCGVILFWFM